jgi:hypothetical protein
MKHNLATVSGGSTVFLDHLALAELFLELRVSMVREEVTGPCSHGKKGDNGVQKLAALAGVL